MKKVEGLTISKDYVENIMRSMMESVIVVSAGGMIQTANQAACGLLGYTEEELLKMHIGTVFEEEEEEEEEEEVYFKKSGIKDLIEKGFLTNIEKTFISKYGKKIPVLFSGSVMRDADSKIQGIVCVATDITERKKMEGDLIASEERYRNLVQTIPDIIYKINMKGYFVFVNNSVRSLGYEPNELIGKHFSEIIHHDDIKSVSLSMIMTEYAGKKTGDEKAPKIFDERRTGKRMTKDLEVRLIRKKVDGKNGNSKMIGTLTAFNDVAASGLYEEQGNSKKKYLIGTVGIIKDITEIKMAEEALKSYSKKLVETQESERKRIALELHDSLGVSLITVKNEMINYLDTLSAGAKGTMGLEMAIDTIDQVVEDVRKISHDLRPPQLDILGLTGAVKSIAEKISRVSGVKIRVNCEANSKISPEIEINLYRIVQEGLTNILKHSDAGKASINLESSNGFIELLISDNGNGFKTTQKNIPFDTEKGFGLYGMAERAKIMGGSFEIDSKPGQGTTLKVRVRAESA